jgi:hypothetical protein
MNLRAIKHGQTIQLLDPLDLPDGEITITIQPIAPDALDAPKSPDPPETFWDAMQKWRREYDVENLDIDPDEIWGDVRDKSPGREFSWDD